MPTRTPSPAKPRPSKTATKTAPATAKPPAKRATTRKSTGKAAGLLAAASGPPTAAGTLPLDLIDPDHWPNPRGEVDQTTDAFTELVDSIRDQGVLQPVAVGPALVETGRHPLAAGWRRYHAARAAGLTAIPVHQLATVQTAVDALVAGVAENVAREDMSALAEARAIDTLMREHKLTQVAVGKRVGMSERTVRERLRLLKIHAASPAIAGAISTGTVPMDAAVVLQSIADVSPQVAEVLADDIANGHVTAARLQHPEDLAYELRELCRERRAPIWVARGHYGDALPLTAAQLERWQQIPPAEAWSTRPPTFHLEAPHILEAAKAAGALIEVDGCGSFIASETFLRGILEDELVRLEQDGQKRTAKATKQKAADAAKAAQEGRSAEDVERERLEREREARQREIAHHANQLLGERLSLNACAALTGDVRAGKALAHLLVTSDLGALLDRGVRYADSEHCQETVQKNGTVRRKYELVAKAVDELRQQIDAATTTAEALAPVLRALLLATVTDEQVTAPSNRSRYSWPYGTYGDTGAGRSSKNAQAQLKDLAAPAREDLKAEATRRAETAAARPAAPVPSAKLGKWARAALKEINATPGLTIPEIADKLGVQQNMLYRILPGLQKDGHLHKQGRGWHPGEVTA